MELKTLGNALNVLECFAKERKHLGLREIARELGVSHTVIHRIVSTFEGRGYLRRAPESRKYTLGMKLLEHGFTLQRRLKLTDLIRPEMRQLSDKIGESVVLTWLDGCQGVYAAIVEGNQQVRFTEELGVRSPLYAGASHKTMLAFMPPGIVETIISDIPNSGPNCVDTAKLRADLELIRERRWCYSSGEQVEDAAAFSVPIFNHRDEIAASLSIASPKFRFSRDEALNTLPLLRESESRINGYFRRYHLGGMHGGIP